MFPFRDRCIPFFLSSPSQGEGLGVRSRNTGCFNYQIGLCPGVCAGKISKKEYAQTIKNIVLFFSGKKAILIKNLQKEMRALAKRREFEKAEKIKRQIFALGHIQDVSLIKDSVSRATLGTDFRIESYDIAHISGTHMVGAMVVLENGEVKKSDYRKFKIQGNTGADDTKALSEILIRRLSHPEWPLPNLIVVDGGFAQKRIIEKVLKMHNLKIPTVSVVKDERHKPKGILGAEERSTSYELRKEIKKQEQAILLANAEAHRFALSFHRKLFRAKMAV